jgi:hypothetical protein
MSRNYAGGVQEGADKRNTYNRRVTEKDACAEWLLLSEAVVKAVNKVYAAKSPGKNDCTRERTRGSSRSGFATPPLFDARHEHARDGENCLLFGAGQVISGCILHFGAIKGIEHLGDRPLVPERVFQSPVDFAPELLRERNDRMSAGIECLSPN